MIRKFFILFLAIFLSIFSFGQSLVNVENEKTLYLGENLIKNCEVSFNTLAWSYGDGCITRFDDSEKSAFVFKIKTKPGRDYFFGVEQDEGTLTNAFHVNIGNGRAADPYNLTKEMSLLLRGDGGYLNIIPVSGKAFKLSNLRFCEISDTITPNSVSISQNSISIGISQSSVGGKWNVAIGDNTTMASNLNATRSIAVGHNALTNLESGIQNLGIGTFALHELKYGERNMGLGPDAMYRTKYGYDNVAIGRGTLANEALSQQDVTLERNVAIGNFAMLMNTKDTHDAVAIGYRANMKSGNQSVSIGNMAGRDGGENNVLIGFNAGVLNHSNGNVAIGYRALRGEFAQGDGNIVIGASADLVPASGQTNNAISIGTGSKAMTGSIVIGAGTSNTKENQVMLGGSNTEETVVYGNLIVCGTDGIERTIQFNPDGTVSWKRVDNVSSIRYTSNSSDNSKHSIYDLQGIAVHRITKPGFYIIDGVKMYINPTGEN